MPYCHACGTDIDETANFCPVCGADQRVESEPVLTRELESAQSSFGGRTGTNALIGGTTGFVLGLFIAMAFTPLYVVGVLIGGGIGGYLQDRGSTSGAKVGALAGLLATAPVILLILLGAFIGMGGLVLGLFGHLPPGEGALGIAGVLFIFGFVLVFSTITNLVFGTLGGVLGGVVAASE